MTNLKNKLDPLNWQVPIVTPDGRPTPEFMRKWAQQVATNSSIIDLSNAAGVSNVLDLLGAVQGDMLYRDAQLWKPLAPGAAHSILQAGGAGANPSWATLSALLDVVFGNAQGDILYRGATVWGVLAPGTSGYVLTTQGAGANPQWAAASGGFIADVEVNAATTAAADTSGFTYNNGVSGVGATFTGTVNTAVTIDGYTFTTVGQTLLVKNDTQSPSGAFNGVYKLTAVQTISTAPVFTRDTSYDTPTHINETGLIAVLSGTANTVTTWLQTAIMATVGTTPLVYVKYSENPATIVISAASLGQHAVVIGADGAQGTKTIANGTTGQVLTAATGADPAFVTPGANPTATAGPAAVNGSATTFMRSDGAPAIQKASNSQFGIIEVDGTTITAASGVISAVQPAGANPTGTAGPAAVNGVATTFMRSDGAPAIQKASAAQFGIVEVDGTTITASGGVISAAGFVPLAAAYHPGYQSGRKYGSPNLIGGTGSTLAVATGTLYFTPFYVGVQTTFTKAWTRTGATGANVEMGIYTDSAGLPGALLADWGDVASALSADVSITISQALSPGWYWVAISASASVTLNGVPATNTGAWFMGQSAISASISGYTQAWTFSTGNLPAVGALTASTSNCPSVWLSP